MTRLTRAVVLGALSLLVVAPTAVAAGAKSGSIECRDGYRTKGDQQHNDGWKYDPSRPHPQREFGDVADRRNPLQDLERSGRCLACLDRRHSQLRMALLRAVNEFSANPARRGQSAERQR